MKRALICGISGQDGGYLAKLLIDKGYKVTGTSRNANANAFLNLKALDVYSKINLISMEATNYQQVIKVLKTVQPDEVYNLSGQSSVALSFGLQKETIESNVFSTLALLDGICFSNKNIKFYNAASSECFGNTGPIPADESTKFNPLSPYAVAKCTSFWMTQSYRSEKNIFACSGILFNHESSFRPDLFVTKKIINTVQRIALGSSEKLHLGNTHIMRDWGWAPEYVDAMWRMLQLKSPEDFVIASGESYSLQDFVTEAFSQKGLDWRNYVLINSDFIRNSDQLISKANPGKAFEKLDWVANTKMSGVIKKMLAQEI
jgi:GDPmannose 4,6-dehydratase